MTLPQSFTNDVTFREVISCGGVTVMNPLMKREEIKVIFFSFVSLS